MKQSMWHHLSLLLGHYRLLCVALAAVFVLQFVFALSFPLNSGASDNPSYLWMVSNGGSNLIHASGYPFIVHNVLRALGIHRPANIFDPQWLLKVQAVQNFMHAIALLVLTFLVCRLFDRRTAVWFVVIAGTAPALLGGLNAGAPEWLQGDLIALSLLLAASGHVTRSEGAKALLYILAFVLGGMNYLIKYNAAVVIPFLALFVLLDRIRFWKRGALLVLSSFAAFLTVQLYIVAIHHPSTGTRQLSFDHGWVLVESLPENYLTRPPDSLGNDALRWLALCVSVPPDFDLGFAYPTIHTGAPPEVKARYRPAYDGVMQMERQELVAMLASRPLPVGFKPRASFIPLYWYIGLAETDALGIRVYFEYVGAHFTEYAGRVLSGLWFWGAPAGQTVPMASNLLGLTLLPDMGWLQWRYYYLPRGANPILMRYWNPSERVWGPGMGGVRILDTLWLPRPIERFLALIVLVAVALCPDRRQRTAALLLLGSVLSIAIVGFILLGFRHKEYIACLPTLAALYALALSFTSNAVLKWRKKSSSQGRPVECEHGSTNG